MNNLKSEIRPPFFLLKKRRERQENKRKYDGEGSEEEYKKREGVVHPSVRKISEYCGLILAGSILKSPVLFQMANDSGEDIFGQRVRWSRNGFYKG